MFIRATPELKWIFQFKNDGPRPALASHGDKGPWNISFIPHKLCVALALPILSGAHCGGP